MYRLIAFVAVIAMLASTATCFAFFGTDSGNQAKTVSESTGAKSDEFVRLVGNEYEFRAAAVDTAFNSPKHLSDNSGRKIITLTNDITLSAIMMVTADCAIDLNGHNIYLNEQELIFRNGYSGVFEIIGSGMFVGPGKVTVDLAHMRMNLETINSYMGEGVIVDSPTYNETSMAGIIFDFVEKKILGGENLGYYCDAIDLPLHYQSFDDIELAYHSNNTNLLDDAGNVKTSSQTGPVDITLDITFKNTGNTYRNTDAPWNRTWTVNIIPLSNKDAWGTAIFNMICDKLSVYEGETTGIYYFGDNIILPGDIDYPEFSSVSYAVFADNGGSIDTSRQLSAVSTSGSSGSEPYLLKPFTGNQYMLNSNVNADSCTAWLSIYWTEKTNGPCGSIPIRIISDSDASKATKELLAGIKDYENQYLEIELTYRSGDVYTYTQHELVNSGTVTLGGVAVTPNVFEYTFEDVNAPYEVVPSGSGLCLRVKESAWGTLDENTEDYFLRASFKYGEGDNAKVGTEYICVHYNARVEQDFYPYYKQLDYALKELKTNNGYTYQTFTMPNNMNGKKPYVQYEIKALDDDAVGKNYITLDNDYDEHLNVASAPALSTFTIDPRKLTPYNHKYRIYYYYSFDGTYWSKINTAGSKKYAEFVQSGMTEREAEHAVEALGNEDYFYYTDITLMGLVSDTSYEPKVAGKLFEAMYQEYGGTTCAGVSGETVRIIPGDNLRAQKESFDIKALNVGRIDDLTGIDLLEYTRKIVLRDSFIRDIDLTPLSSMENLEDLDLGNTTGATSSDFTSANVLQNDSFYRLFTDSDGDGWSDMKNLRILRLDNNMIREFKYLDQFPALEEVHVYGQFVRTSNVGLFGIIDGIVNAIYEELYGSNGAVNSGVFASAQARGTLVYTDLDANGNPKEYDSENSDVSDYVGAARLMRGVVYQERTAYSFGNNQENRASYLEENIFGKWQTGIRYPVWAGIWYLGRWSYSDNGATYIPSSEGFKVLADSDSGTNESGWLEAGKYGTPPELNVSPGAVNGRYTLEIARMQQTGSREADWHKVLEQPINIKVEANYIDENGENLNYNAEARPNNLQTNMLMMVPMMMNPEDELNDIGADDIYSLSNDAADE